MASQSGIPAPISAQPVVVIGGPTGHREVRPGQLVQPVLPLSPEPLVQLASLVRTLPVQLASRVPVPLPDRPA